MAKDPFGFGDDPFTPSAPSGRGSLAGRARNGGGPSAPAGPPPRTGQSRTGGWATGWSGSPRGAVRPPVAWLVGALAVAVLAALAALILGRAVGVAVVCWLAAGPVAIGLVAIFVLRDTRAAAAPIYLRPQWIRPLWAVTIIGVVVGIAVSAWRIADWWGRL